ncbi:MAG: hypothetical protein JOY69_01615 [Candidatus Eremiobacteraeota bacterium]|nr:hypothetical protein [Candidatus Eremiobacteraeota bacterium]
MFVLRSSLRLSLLAGMLAAVFVASGCGVHDGGVAGNGTSLLPAARSRASSETSILNQLNTQAVIGSTVDPVNGAQNPYGLAVAPATAGAMTAGDLVVCNFNAEGNTQGSGRSIVVLHPAPGAKPQHLIANHSILGCDALALAPDDTIWAAAMVGNDDAIVSSSGHHLFAYTGKPFNQPWGQVYAAPPSGTPAFYESDAATGRIARISLGSPPKIDVIAGNFPRNRGVPGSVLAPSGLAYDPAIDTLYFADGQNNTVVAFKNVSTFPKYGVVAKNHGMQFSGPSAADARIVYSGSPLNGPISTALLPNGNLIVGNTLDPNGTNLLVELSTSSGQVLATRNVDTGAAGALFGIAITGASSSDTKIYFNDDNANNVQVLEH